MSSDPQLALYKHRDIVTIQSKLFENWESFLDGRKLPNQIRPEILQSWKRCQTLSVDPLQKEAPVLDPVLSWEESFKQSDFYQLSLKLIEQCFHQIKGTEHLITLSDQHGKIIHLQGDHTTLSKAEHMNFILGADWSEQKAGSNAIGTSLAIGKPVQIFSFEHYCQGVHPWVCSAAPIRDPVSKALLGVIDLTGPSSLAQPHSLSLVHSMSQLIEYQLGEKAQAAHQALLAYYQEQKRKGPADAIAILNKELIPIHTDPRFLALFQCQNKEELLRRDIFLQLQQRLKERREAEWEWQFLSTQEKLLIRSIKQKGQTIGYALLMESRKASRASQTKQHLWKGPITVNQRMQTILHKAMTVANTDVPILITGESGTGKEVLATTIHQHSQRKEAAFVTVNCGAIPKELIASELFGYEAGAFTGGNPKGKKGKFEEADGGTIFLDEIGEMPLELQVHLLRVLEAKEVVRLGSSKAIPLNIRVLAATNRQIDQLIAKKAFREDLYYRLNVVEIHLPALRERMEDLSTLVDHFVDQFAQRYEKALPTVDQAVYERLKQHHWPGNIRELRNVIEYALLFHQEGNISLDALPKSFQKTAPLKQDAMDWTALEVEERKRIQALLIETNGNISEVARRCGIARSTLYRKINKYQL